MITFVFDREGAYGLVPNLVEKTDIIPKSKEWWDLCITPPYSYEFRLMRYMDVERIPYNAIPVEQVEDSDKNLFYPINLNFFDPEIDYIGLMKNESKELVRQNKMRILFYYSEGDNPKKQIAPSLKEMCETHQLPIENIKFVIANKALTSRHPYVYFPDDELYYRYLHLYNQNYVTKVNVKPRSKVFTCLNRMDKPHRKLFAGSLWYHGLAPHGYFSYQGKEYDIEYNEKLKDPIFKWHKFWREVNQLFDNFDLITPIKCDELSDRQHNDHKLIDQRFFTDAYINFVTETHFNKNNIFLTEKTFKPILNMQPFIIVGAPGSIKLLKDLGYKTFDTWWDESYDDIKDDEERMYRLFGIAYDLCLMNHSELTAMIKEMIPVLAHNQQVFLNSKHDRIETLLNKITG